MTHVSTLIIGIGNRYRGDDAFGCIIADEMAGMMLPNVNCIEHDGEPTGLMDCWLRADKVVLIDAVSSGAEAGTIFRLNLMQQALPAELNLPSTHAFGVSQAVELARTLQKLPPEILFIGLEGECFDAGEPLSPILSEAKDAVIAEVINGLELKESIRA